MSETRGLLTWAEIDLAAIAHNTAALARLARPAALMAVVKADAYGHGAAPVARTALAHGAAWLGVAQVDEGVQLRQAGVTAPILVMGATLPEQADAVVRHGLCVAVVAGDLLAALDARARALGRRVPVHLKVDTGMGRLGRPPGAELTALARAVANLPGLVGEGLFTHLASADEADSAQTQQQLERFAAASRDLAAAGLLLSIRHAANSAGLLAHPEARFDLVRSGIALYGAGPSATLAAKARLRPVMSWKARIVFVKQVPADAPIGYGATYRTEEQETIATLPVGYADGFSRAWSNRGSVLVGGRRCPVVGRVCMDQTMVRIPAGVAVNTGDAAVLLGEQAGAAITVDELARGLGTIPYEVLCLVGRRVVRIYLNKDAENAANI